MLPVLLSLPAALSVPVVFSTFEDAFGLVVLILVFIALYKYLSDSFIESPFLALLVAIIILFLIVIPYAWVKYFLFVVLVMYGFFTTFKPWEW